jgi:hypothetical protein
VSKGVSVKIEAWSGHAKVGDRILFTIHIRYELSQLSGFYGGKLINWGPAWRPLSVLAFAWLDPLF